MNSIVVSGRLVNDGKVIEKGDFKVWKGGVAVQRDYKEKGKDTYATDFFDITAFGGTVDYLSRNAKKGDNVIIQGKLYFDEYIGKDNVKRKTPFIKVDTINVLAKYNVSDANATNSTDGTELVSVDGDFIEITDESDEDIPF